MSDSLATKQEPDRNSMTEEEKRLLDAMAKIPRLKELISSPQIQSRLQEVLDVKKQFEENAFKRKENALRQQGDNGGSGGGIKPEEDTILKDFILESPDFKELIEILLNDVI